MSMPGFAAEASLYPGGSYRQAGAGSIAGEQVVAAIPPCHACNSTLEECATGGLRGAVCRYCAIGYCDPQRWKRPPRPFPHSEPWNVPF